MSRVTNLRIIGLLLSAIVLARPVCAQTYTITPTPFQTAFDNSGNTINNACVWTYVAGTLTPATTYADNAGTPNANPIRSDPAGRFTAYLVPGSSYKYVYESACTPPAHGTTLRTADNITAMPASSATVDVTGTAGEAITAGQCVYLSDGSGAKTAGQWFKCDSTNAYSSTHPPIGLATASISSATSGTIRLAGVVPGLSSLSVGADYFVSTAGAITATAPANVRYIGRADSSTTLVVKNPLPLLAPFVDDFRLSLTTATCVTTADVTAATTLYLTPCFGNRITVFSSAGLPESCSTTEVSIAVPATTSTLYDVWAYDSTFGTCTMALELLAWTNDTTRATAIARTNGRWTKSGDSTRLYVGSFRTTTVSGQTESSFAKRYVWNMYNRMVLPMRVADPADSWASAANNTWAQANASTANQLDCVVGVAEEPITIEVQAGVLDSTVAAVNVSIGEDSTTTPVAGVLGIGLTTVASTTLMQIRASVVKYPAIGRHFYARLERTSKFASTTWYGDNADSTLIQGGIQGWIRG